MSSEITGQLKRMQDEGKSGVNKVQIVDSNGVNLNTPSIGEAEITRLANTTQYSTGDTINNTVAVKQKETIIFTGTSGTLNINVAGLTLLATFDTSISQTAINFESAHVLDLAAVGVTMTRELEVIVIEATTAGDPFATATVTQLTGDLDAEVAIVAANVTNAAPVISNIISAIGQKKTLIKVSAKTDMPGFAGKVIVVRCINGEITAIGDDNVIASDTYTDDFIGQVSITMGLAAGNIVRGQSAEINIPFVSQSLDIPFVIIAGEAITPTSGGKISVELIIE